MNNTFPMSSISKTMVCVKPPQELVFLRAVTELQLAFQSTTPAAKFYKSNFSGFVSCERIRKTTAFLKCSNMSLEKYNEQINTFQNHQFLQIFQDGNIT